MSGYKQALNDLNAGGDSVTKKGKKENLQERMRKKFRRHATSIASSNSENVSPVGEASGVTHPDAYDEHTDRGTESSRPVRHSSRTNIPSPSMESTKSGHSTNSEIDLNAPDANGNYLFSDGKHSSPKTIRANHAKEVAKNGNTSKLKEEQNDVVRPKIRDIHQRRKQKTKTPKVRQVENDHEDTALNQILDEINSGEKAKKQRRSKKLLSRRANRAEGIVDETDSDSKRRGGKTPYEVMELSSSESDDGEYKAREEETIEKKGSLFKHHHPNAQPPKEDESDSEEEYDLKLMYRLLGRRRVGDPPLQKPPVTFVGGMGLGGTPMLDRHERRRQRQLEREELERDPLKKFLAGRLCYSDEEEDDDPFRELLDLIGNPNDQENQEGGNAANGGLGGMGIPQPSNEDPMAQFERFTRQGENIGNIPDSPLLRQLMEPPKQLPENTPQRELMKMLLGEDDGSDPPQSDLMKQLKSQPGGFNPIPPPSQQPSPSDLMRQMMGGGDPGEGLPPPSQSDMVRQMMRGGRGRGEGDLPRPPSDLMRQMMGRGRQQGEGDFPAPPNDIMRQLLGRGGGGQGDGDFPSPPDDLMRQLMGGGRPQQGDGDFPSPPDDLMQQLMGGGRPQQAQGGMPAPPSDLMQQMMGGGRQQGEGDLPRPPSDLMRQLIGGGRPKGEENDLLRRLSGIGRHEEFDVPRRRPPQRQRPPPNQDRPGLIAPLHPKNPSANPPKPAGSNQPPPVAGSNQPEEEMNIDVECPADSEVVHQMLAYEATRARNSEESRGQRAMNTIIILDVSGSMAGEPFIQAALFINQFITGLEQMQFEYNLEENVALVTVSEKAEVVQHFTNNYSQIRRAVDVLIAGGSSRLHMGLVMPTALLSAGPRDGRAGLLTIHEHLVCPRVIFISDGQVSHEADVPGQTLKHDDPRVNMMQNLCTQMVQQVTGRTLCRMYCVPVGDCNQVFLEVLCEEAGGRVLQQREAIMASRAHLHHNVVAKLKLTRSDEPSRETISSTMKTVTGSEEEGEVDAVLEIWRQGEPDIEARGQKVANDARQRRESGVPGVQDRGQGQLHDGVPMMGAGLGLGRGGSLAGMFGSGRGMPAFGGMGGRDFAGHLGAEGRGILPVGGGGGNRGGGEMVMPPVGGMWAGDFLGRKGEASQKPYGSSSANNGAVPKTRVNKIALDAKSSERRSLSGEPNGTKPKTVSKITETQDEMMQISDSDDSETSGDDCDSEDEEEIEQNLPINDLRRKGFKVRSAEEMKALCDEHKKKTLKQLKAMKKQWRQEEKAESARLRAIPDEEMSPLMRISAQLKGGKDVVRKRELSWWQSELYDVMTDSEDELEQDKRGKENLCKVFNLDPNIFKRNRENVDSPEEEVISEKDGKENEADSGARPKQQKPAWKSHRLAGNQIDDCSSTDEMEVKVERPRRRKPHHSKKGGDQGRFDIRRQNSNTTRMKPETDTSGEDDKPIGGLG